MVLLDIGPRTPFAFAVFFLVARSRTSFGGDPFTASDDVPRFR